MKALIQFLMFMWAAFAQGKIFSVTGVREWLDFKTKEKLGWCVDTVIIKDETPYKAKDGNIISNLYSPVTFKITSDVKPTVSIGDSVEPINPACTVYGEFKDKLSVKCSGVRVVPATGKKD